MKKVMVFVFIFCSADLMAQNVAINNTNAVAGAMPDVSSNTKGMLIPRMNSTARGNIQNPATGLMVFDNTTNSFWSFAGSWKEIPASANGGGSPTGIVSGDLMMKKGPQMH